MHDYENYLYIDDGKIYKLNETENELFDLFIKNKGHLITRDDICQRLYLESFKAYEYDHITHMVSKLRKKFNLHISTITGRGYCLRGK